MIKSRPIYKELTLPDQAKFLRVIGLFGLTMIGLGSMIGSGWLFGSFFAAQLAGPAAIFAWIIGGAAAMLVALTLSELGAALPKAGGTVRYLDYSHGGLASCIGAWSNWLGLISSVPSEAEASIQYMSSWKWAWAQNLYDIHTHSLTHTGLIGSSILLLFYFFVNYWSLQFFVRFVSMITLFKIIVPILTAVALLYTGFHPDNFTSAGHSFMPYGWTSVVTAVVTCGIVFSFNGFQSPINMAAEAKRPGINIPLSAILGILLALVIYILLQTAFIGAVPSDMLAKAGWHGIEFHSPLAELAIIFQLNFIAMLLYIDSFVSPSGTGVIYMAGTARMLYGMQRNKYLPDFIGMLHPKYHLPRNALIVNLIVAFVFMFCFSGWAHIVAVVSVANIIGYIPWPIALGGLRRVAPDLPRIFKLKWADGISALVFVIISLLLFWARWPLTGQMFLLLLLGFVIYFYYQYKQGWPQFQQQLKAAWWIFAYLIGLTLISWLGAAEFGGLGYLSPLASHVVVIVFAIVIYFWAVRSAWRTPAIDKAIASVVG